MGYWRYSREGRVERLEKMEKFAFSFEKLKANLVARVWEKDIYIL